MALNTKFKITTIEGTLLWDYEGDTRGVGVDYAPNNENQNARMEGETTKLDYTPLSLFIPYGLSPKSAVLQGLLIDESTNKDQWILSSLKARKKLVKLWLGEDWYYYAFITDITFSRDASQPGFYSANVAFTAYDPFMYNAGGSGGDDPAITTPLKVTITGANFSGVTADIELNTLDSSLIDNSTYIEPFFLITGGTSTNISQLKFKDQDGREIKCDFTEGSGTGGSAGNLINDDRFLVCPYHHGEYPEQYNPQTPIVYVGASSSAPANTEWFLDLNLYDSTDFSQSSNQPVRDDITSSTNTTPATGGTYKGSIEYNYPRWNDNETRNSNKATITVTATGTTTDITIDAVYVKRRV